MRDSSDTEKICLCQEEDRKEEHGKLVSREGLTHGGSHVPVLPHGSFVCLQVEMPLQPLLDLCNILTSEIRNQVREPPSSSVAMSIMKWKIRICALNYMENGCDTGLCNLCKTTNGCYSWMFSGPLTPRGVSLVSVSCPNTKIKTARITFQVVTSAEKKLE